MLRLTNLKARLPKRLLRSSKIRIFPRRHGLDIWKCRQIPRRIQVVNDREVFVQIGKEQNGKVQPCILYRECRVLKTLPLLLKLNLSFDDIAVRNLSGPLLLLRDIQESLCLLQSL